MNAYKVIDRDTWPRRKLFDYFQAFASPTFNLTVALDARAIYRYAKKNGESFFLMTLYAILRAANDVPQIRQRILPGGDIVEFERVAAMTPIMTGAEMFRQIRCEYEPAFPAFRAIAAAQVAAAKEGRPCMTEEGCDFICASCVPWVHFTGIDHAQYTFSQELPILTWGKMSEEGKIPVGVKFSHSFLDGLHVGRFFNSLETSFKAPDRLLSE